MIQFLYKKLNVQALGMTEPEYGRLIKIMLEAGLIKGFHPIRKNGPNILRL
ncbi:hypothetical protein OL548_18715 [Lysinibacillus sp. MHQ-1]|nr:hypothetical protein OL548_18715 [Lysinibacillus sp. MHQ-1]